MSFSDDENKPTWKGCVTLKRKIAHPLASELQKETQQTAYFDKK